MEAMIPRGLVSPGLKKTVSAQHLRKMCTVQVSLEQARHTEGARKANVGRFHAIWGGCAASTGPSNIYLNTRGIDRAREEWDTREHGLEMRNR